MSGRAARWCSPSATRAGATMRSVRCWRATRSGRRAGRRGAGRLPVAGRARARPRRARTRDLRRCLCRRGGAIRRARGSRRRRLRAHQSFARAGAGARDVSASHRREPAAGAAVRRACASLRTRRGVVPRHRARLRRPRGRDCWNSAAADSAQVPDSTSRRTCRALRRVGAAHAARFALRHPHPQLHAVAARHRAAAFCCRTRPPRRCTSLIQACSAWAWPEPTRPAAVAAHLLETPAAAGRHPDHAVARAPGRVRAAASVAVVAQQAAEVARTDRAFAVAIAIRVAVQHVRSAAAAAAPPPRVTSNLARQPLATQTRSPRWPQLWPSTQRASDSRFTSTARPFTGNWHSRYFMSTEAQLNCMRSSPFVVVTPAEAVQVDVARAGLDEARAVRDLPALVAHAQVDRPAFAELLEVARVQHREPAPVGFAHAVALGRASLRRRRLLERWLVDGCARSLGRAPSWAQPRRRHGGGHRKQGSQERTGNRVAWGLSERFWDVQSGQRSGATSLTVRQRDLQSVPAAAPGGFPAAPPHATWLRQASFSCANARKRTLMDQIVGRK